MPRHAWPVALALILLLAGCTTPPPEDGAEPPEEPPVEETPPEPPAPVSLAVRTTGNWVVAVAEIGFDPATLSAPTGAEVTLTLTNDDIGVSHGWVAQGVEGAALNSVDAGASDSVTFTAPAPGEYTFYCPIGNHRERGQEGTFTVTAV